MKIKAFILAVILVVVWQFPATVGASPTASEQLVIQGRQALFSGGHMTVSGLLAARDLFASAVAEDPANPDALAFYGFTHALAFLYETGSTSGIDNLGELFEAFGSPRASDRLDDTPLFAGLPEHDGKYDPPATLPDGAALQTFIEYPFLARVDEVIAALALVDDSYTTTITPDETGGDPVAIDQADIRALRAMAYGARCWALVVSAYDLDFSLADVVQRFNADALQIQRDLLEAHPDLLQLGSDGASRLNEARDALDAMIDDYRAAHDHIADRVYTDNDWRPQNMFTVANLQELSELGFHINQMTETQQSLDGNHPATFTTYREEWVFTDDISGEQIRVSLKRDDDWNLANGTWKNLGCTFLGCRGPVADLDYDGSGLTLVLGIDDGCNSQVTLAGTLSGDVVSDGTYSGSNCAGPVAGDFDAIRAGQDDTIAVIDFNAFFGNTGKAPLDIRAVLPAFNADNLPVVDTFPVEPILNGLFPGATPLLATNDDATRRFDLMPEGVFSIPATAITIDGDYSDWPIEAQVFTDIDQDDPEAVYGGHADLKSFWMAQDLDYYYFRTVYHDGAAPPGVYPTIYFAARVYHEDNAWEPWPPSCDVAVNPATGSGNLNARRSSFENQGGSDWVRTGVDGSGDAFVEWRVTKSVLGDLTGRFIEINTAGPGGEDENLTYIQYPGDSVDVGDLAIDGYTGGKILLWLYNGPTPDLYNSLDFAPEDLRAAVVVDGPGPVTIDGIAYLEGVNTWLFAVWDQDGNGIADFGDQFGVTSFYYGAGFPSLPVNESIDFAVTGCVTHVHESDGSSSTLLGVEIWIDEPNAFYNDIDDVIENIDSIAFEGPGGVLATRAHPQMEYEKYSENYANYWIYLPGQPELGPYTFSVTSGNTVRTSTDDQTIIREIPLLDVSRLAPQPGDTLNSMTPIFSWDPVSYGDIPLYYRLQILDDQGQTVFKTPRTQDMTTCAVPAGVLEPGQAYSWRVRVSDRDNWIETENRSQTDWHPLVMAPVLDHPAMPVVDLDSWGAVATTVENDTTFSLWVKVIDHDGVAENSHTVIATPPAGSPVTLTHDGSEGAKTAFFGGGVDPAETGILLDDYSGDWTFTVTDPGGNTTATVDTLTVVPLPVPDQASFQPADGSTVADTTPTLRWDAISGPNADTAKRYRVKIFSDDTGNQVWGGNVGLGTAYTVPPGVLEAHTTYRYYVSVRDAVGAFDVDNEARAPEWEHMLHFTTGPESPDPYIYPYRSNAHTWNNSFGTTLSFDVMVFDPQGVPDNITSVKAILPGGQEVRLRFDDRERATAGSYFAVSDHPPTSGSYTLRVEDREGHVYETTEWLDSNPMGAPDEDSFSPVRSTLIGSTAVSFDWEDVDGAAFYRVEIYDEHFDRIYRFVATESRFDLPEGYLEEGKYYAYRITIWREFFDEIDNAASRPTYRSNLFNFVTTATPGSHPPTIDTDNQGAFLWQKPKTDRSGTSDYWMAFRVNITDPDGPPHAIERVEVIFPDGNTRKLSYDENEDSDTATYWYKEDIDDPTDMPIGPYVFTARDVNGNTAMAVMDSFTPSVLPVPTNLWPGPAADVYGTTPTLKWDAVDGAALYRVDIYDETGSRIHKSYPTDPACMVPAGILELNQTYAYQVYAYGEDFNLDDLDNMSSSMWVATLRPTFTVRPGTDTDSDGVPDDQDAFPTDPAEWADHDLDGTGDNADPDDDNDGQADPQDAFPFNAAEWRDTDGDGTGDNADADDDGDGMPDQWEQQYGLDPLADDAAVDQDGDGFANLREYQRQTDPLDPESYPPKAMPWIPLLLMDG